MIDRNARQNEQEYKTKRNGVHKIFIQKKKSIVLNQSWSKWKLLIITVKKINFIRIQ